MDGSIKIGDFGLVTAIEENCCDSCYSNTQSPLLHDGRRHTDQVGTKLYMSPEQVSVCVWGWVCVWIHSCSSLVTDYVFSWARFHCTNWNSYDQLHSSKQHELWWLTVSSGMLWNFAYSLKYTGLVKWLKLTELSNSSRYWGHFTWLPVL